MVGEVVLVVGLGRPEGGRLGDLGDDGIGVGTGQFGDHGLGRRLLLHRMPKDGGSVLRADIVALAVEGGRVVDGEEDGEQVGVADHGRIETDLHGFGVTSAAGADLFVGGLIVLPADVARNHGFDPIQLQEGGFQAPETLTATC